MARKQLANFDDFASDYHQVLDQSIHKISGTDGDFFSEYKILEVKNFLEGKKILDFGCGDGNSAFFINKNVSSYEYIGIDISAKSIDQAQKRNLPNSSFVVYDGSHIPFDDYSFDVVFVACVFHHVEFTKHIDVLKEIHRVLKNKGKVIIFEHNPFNPLTLKIVHDCPFDVGVKLITAGKMKEKLHIAGFVVAKRNMGMRFTLFFPRKAIFKKLLPLEKKLWWCSLGGQYYCIGETQ